MLFSVFHWRTISSEKRVWLRLYDNGTLHGGMNQAVVRVCTGGRERELVRRPIRERGGGERDRRACVGTDLVGCAILVCPGYLRSGLYREDIRGKGEVFDQDQS